MIDGRGEGTEALRRAATGEHGGGGMMNKVESLDEHRPHETRNIHCFICDKEWQAVFPEECKEVECPSCGAMRPLQTYSADIIGPFRGGYYYLTAGGYKLPNIKLYKRDDTVQDWTIQLDDRFEIDVSTIEVLRWAWLLGSAMAIGAGYSCFGKNSQPFNRYKTRMSEISDDNTE